jgi:hypothetical protein
LRRSGRCACCSPPARRRGGAGSPCYRYNIDFSATGAALWNPIVAGIWIAAGLVIVLGFPGVARRVAAALA